MLGKVEEKRGFRQWQQQPSRKQQLLPVTDSHCCRLAQISRAASGVRHETMPAMPAKGGVGRACMNETAIDSGSDRGQAHVHNVVHKMRARGRVLACAHAHACASACCVRPRGWHGRLICGAGVIGRRGLLGVHIRRQDIAAGAYLHGRRRNKLRIERGVNLCCHSCLRCSCITGAGARGNNR